MENEEQISVPWRSYRLGVFILSRKSLSTDQFLNQTDGLGTPKERFPPLIFAFWAASCARLDFSDSTSLMRIVFLFSG